MEKIGEMNNNKMKHLDMIESVIGRMGQNSFQLKGWAVTLLTIVGALATKEADKKFMILAFIPLLAFWGLDAFYLQLERKYKRLYEIVASKNDNEIDFNMSTSAIEAKYDLKNRLCYCNGLFSKTEVGFYGSLIITVILCVYFNF